MKIILKYLADKTAIFLIMKAYRVYENIQSCDGDGWEHWVVDITRSYHLSVEGVQVAVYELLKQKAIDLEINKQRNLHITDWTDEESSIANNLAEFTVGTKRREELPIFSMEVIEIED